MYSLKYRGIGVTLCLFTIAYTGYTGGDAARESLVVTTIIAISTVLDIGTDFMRRRKINKKGIVHQNERKD